MCVGADASNPSTKNAAKEKASAISWLLIGFVMKGRERKARRPTPAGAEACGKITAAHTSLSHSFIAW